MAQGRSSQEFLRVLYDVTRDAIGLVIPETCPVCGCSGTLCRDCKDDLQQPPVRFSPHKIRIKKKMKEKQPKE